MRACVRACACVRVRACVCVFFFFCLYHDTCRHTHTYTQRERVGVREREREREIRVSTNISHKTHVNRIIPTLQLVAEKDISAPDHGTTNQIITEEEGEREQQSVCLS